MPYSVFVCETVSQGLEQSDREMEHFYRTNPKVVILFFIASFILVPMVVLPKIVKQVSLFSFSWTTTNIGMTSSFSPISSDEKKQNVLMDSYKGFKDNSIRNRIKKRGNTKLGRLEAGLAKARALIRETAKNPNCTSAIEEDENYVLEGDIYRNACLFRRSYQLMEKVFKIFIYEEGEPPLFHMGPCKSIYSSEGIFLSFMETNTQFRTLNPDEAHVYYLPFSVVMIVSHLFDPIIRDKGVLKHVIRDYVNIISHKYPYWNRSLGADHFMLSCHDWGPRATRYVPELYYNSIRVLCNANTSENFNPKKDVSFPEINLRNGEIKGLTVGLPASNRTILAFFAGRLHGKIRPALLQHWKGNDKDVQVYETLPNGISYQEMMMKSKYCICPSGYEVASPRIVEAIYAECVPVILSQNYVLPFSDVLDWGSFSVWISISEIPEMKEILMRIDHDQYLRMKKRVKQVQHHFVINNPPKRFDLFNMIIHSIWLRRLNVKING